MDAFCASFWPDDVGYFISRIEKIGTPQGHFPDRRSGDCPDCAVTVSGVHSSYETKRVDEKRVNTNGKEKSGGSDDGSQEAVRQEDRRMRGDEESPARPKHYYSHLGMGAKKGCEHGTQGKLDKRWDQLDMDSLDQLVGAPRVKELSRKT